METTLHVDLEITRKSQNNKAAKEAVIFGGYDQSLQSTNRPLHLFLLLHTSFGDHGIRAVNGRICAVVQSPTITPNLYYL